MRCLQSSASVTRPGDKIYQSHAAAGYSRPDAGNLEGDFMPITGIHWAPKTGRDIHVLRNGSPTRDLRHQALTYSRQGAPNQFADEYAGGDVDLTFTPLFTNAQQGDNFVGDHNGITVNMQTGVVTVAAGVPPNVKNNFIVEVSAKSAGHADPFTETIRVQVHTSVTQVWLTPASLLVRPALVAWQPKIHFSVGQSLVDANQILQAVTAVTVPITHVSITNNVVTLTLTQILPAGAKVVVAGLTGATFLNGQDLTITSATATQITAAFTHPDFDSDDNGDAVADSGSGLSGDGPGPPAFADAEHSAVTDNQLTWTSQGADWTLNTPYRFALRAQFDDDVVGDLTDNHDVTWGAPGGHMEADGTISLLAADAIGHSFPVTATLPPALGGDSTLAGPTVEVGRTWLDEPAPPTITIVAGGGLPATGAVEDSPNVLMLGDGFRASDVDAFNRIVDTFVHYLKANTLANPFNLLSSRMNFWRAFLPATDAGIAFRSEMYFSGIHPWAKVIPAVTKPPAQGQWELEHLLYAVGLPIPAEGAVDPGSFKDRWKLLVQNDPWPHVTLDLVQEWQGLAKRAFIEERDGFPGMSYGEPPAANLSDTTELGLHEDRAGVIGLRGLYPVLASPGTTLADGRAIGAVWTEDAFRFNNRTLVVAISSLPDGRGVNHRDPTSLEVFRYIAVSTKAPPGAGRSGAIPVRKVAGRNTYTLDFTMVPADVDPDRSRTVAHELGHSFGLGDEYAQFDSDFPRPHASPLQANLQTEADTQIPDPHDATKSIISGDQISWVWHRILAATVVTGDITAELSEGLDAFRIPVTPDVSFRFVTGDQLLLRPRSWGQPLRKFDPQEISGALIVLKDPQPDSVLVRAVGAISAQRFPAGSLLFKPRPAPGPLLTAAYPFAEMVAKNIKDAITANHAPLSELPCKLEGTGHDPQDPVLDKTQGRTSSVAGLLQDLSGNVIPFLNMTKIVGLYANGATYACGIFHPTGRCMMRNNHEDQTEFCAVCRYILVDMIAPEFHSDIDARYEKIYADTLGTLYG